GSAAEHDGRTRDGARRRRGHAVHERPDGLVGGEAPEVWRRDDDEEVAREEDAERGERAAERPGDEIPDEGRRDDDRRRRYHGDGDGIEELPVREPVEALDDAAVEERHDGEPASEDERARLGEEPPDAP